jgi:hypothetical protein
MLQQTESVRIAGHMVLTLTHIDAEGLHEVAVYLNGTVVLVPMDESDWTKLLTAAKGGIE